MPGSSKYTTIMQFSRGKESFDCNQATLFLLIQLLEKKEKNLDVNYNCQFLLNYWLWEYQRGVRGVRKLLNIWDSDLRREAEKHRSRKKCVDSRCLFWRAWGSLIGANNVLKSLCDYFWALPSLSVCLLCVCKGLEVTRQKQHSRVHR